MNVEVNGKKAGPNSRVLIVIDAQAPPRDFGETTNSWVNHAEEFVRQLTGMRPFTWWDSAGQIIIGDSSLVAQDGSLLGSNDAAAGRADLLAALREAVAVVDPTQTLVVRIDPATSADASAVFGDQVRRISQESGIRIIGLAAEGMAVATVEHMIEGRVCGGQDPATGEFSTIDVCSCGLAFFGASVAAADRKWHEHAQPQLRMPVPGSPEALDAYQQASNEIHYATDLGDDPDGDIDGYDGP